VYVGQTKETLEKRLEGHLKDKNDIVFKSKQHHPKISLICNYPCFCKQELTYCETYYINQFAKQCGDKILNTRQNNENKVKKEIKFECSIMKEADLLKKIQKKFDIKDYENRGKLQITYKENGKCKSIERRYNASNKAAVMEEMEEKRKELASEFAAMFD
jgi:hypothetical protein